MNEERITYNECLQIFDVSEEFLQSLYESGLIDIVTEEKTQFVLCHNTHRIEQFVRWHYDLEINIQGIEALSHMLERVQKMQDEIQKLNSELKFYQSL